MDNECALDAESRQHTCERAEEMFSVDTEQHVCGTGGIRQRAQNVEYRTDAKLTADRTDVLHRLMITLGKEKGKPDAPQFLTHLLGRLVDVDPECLQTVRRTALRGRGTVAVLADLEPCRRCEKRGGGGHVNTA